MLAFCVSRMHVALIHLWHAPKLVNGQGGCPVLHYLFSLFGPGCFISGSLVFGCVGPGMELSGWIFFLLSSKKRVDG
jgi:hypothetical protein